MINPEGYPSTRKDNIVVQDMKNEVLVYDLNAHKALHLNSTAALVWRELNGKNSVADISRNASAKSGTLISEDMVWLSLSQFKKDNLLEEAESFATIFDGLSRREIIKRVGFASIVALPVVASLVAPEAINAQSTACSCTAAPGSNSRPPGCPCNANSQCCNNVCGGGGTTCAVSTGVIVGPGCCPSVVCPPANGVNPPGCGCNANANCVSGTCVANICRF